MGEVNSPFQKDGPKRRRNTRRDYGYGQKSMWRTCTTNFKREREARLLKNYYQKEAT
jgi:hypothetical protein